MKFDKKQFLEDLYDLSILELQELVIALEEYFKNCEPIVFGFVCPSKRLYRDTTISLKNNIEVFKLNGGEIMKEKRNIPSVKNFESRIRSVKDTIEKNSEQMVLDKTPLELYHLVKNNNFNFKPVEAPTKYHKGLDKTDIYQAVWAIHCFRHDLEIKTMRDVVDNYDMMTLIKMTPSLGTVRAVALYKFIETTGVKMKI